MMRLHGIAATDILRSETRYDTYLFTEGLTAATLIHEALHSHFMQNDLRLATKLDVREHDLSTGGSGVITAVLQRNGCHD